MNIINYVIAYVRREIRSMVKTWRDNQRWNRDMADVAIDATVPTSEWCHAEAAQPVMDKIITKRDDRDTTERVLNEYRLAKFKERSAFHRHAPAQEQVRRAGGRAYMRWPSRAAAAVAAE